jgi:hypothetical protein
MNSLRGLAFFFFLAAVLSQTGISQTKINDFLSYDGAVRLGFYTVNRTGRDGSTSNADDWRVRVHLGIRADISRAAFFKMRFAGRFSTDQNDASFILKDHITGSGGLQLGESTFDEMYLNLRAFGLWTIRLGRMQTKFELAGIPRKSLWRNDSPSSDITWTDGIYVSGYLYNEWQIHLIAQHNSRNGGTTVLRPPLTFTDSASRVGFAGAVNRTSRSGRIAQQELSVTFIPSSLRVMGGQTDDYFAFAAQSALRFDTGFAGAHLLLAGEVGYAPNTQSEQIAGIGQSGSVGVEGLAFQISLNLMNAYRNHNLGVLFGDIGAGWLISPDFRENNREVEVRYLWQISPKLNTEHRIRVRTDREKLVTAGQKREEVDLYFRFTWRF